jgi:small subunit ribosomal protein S14
MAKKSRINKTNRLKEGLAKSVAAGTKPVMPTRVHNRCGLCGRIHGYMRKFNMCRICFRENAVKGLIPGLKKSAW